MNRFRQYVPWVGPILFVIVLSRLDWGEVQRICQTLQLFPIFVGICTIPLEIVFRAGMFKALSILKIPIPFRKCLKIHLIDLAFSTLTPAGIGGFVKLSSVKGATGQGWTECLALVLFDKLVCFITLSLLACVGVCVFLSKLEVIWEVVALLLLSSSLFGIFLVFGNAISFIRSRKPYFHLLQALKGIGDLFLHRPRISSLVFGLSILSWLCLFSRNFAYARGLGMAVAFSYFLLIWPLVVIVGLLPISISGIGIRELVLIACLTRLGITKEQAVSLSLLEILLFLLLPVTVGLWVYYQRENVKRDACCVLRIV